MVKGVSREVIVVRSPDRKLFEQAIFILRDDVPREGITDEMLLREAKRAARRRKDPSLFALGPIWALGGALTTAAIWLLTGLL